MVKHAALLVLASFCLQPYASPDEQLLRKLGLKSDPKFIELKGPGGMFSLEYPEKDWQVVPGGGSVVLTLAQKGNQAFIVIDHTRSDISLSPDEVGAVFLESERARVASRQSGARVIAATLTTTPAGPVAVLHYTRPGLKAPESVVQYSVPFGQDLFRLICSAQTAQFAKFEPVFVHVATSFLPGAAAPGPSPSSGEVREIKAGDGMTPPRTINDVWPIDPRASCASTIGGTVMMHAETGIDITLWTRLVSPTIREFFDHPRAQ